MDDIVDINTLFGPLPVSSADLAVDDLLGLMQKHQVRAACTLSTLGILLDAAVGNAATRAACEEQSQLLPVATFNPTMFLGDTSPFERLAGDGFRLVRFFPTVQNWIPDFAPFHALLRSIEKSGLPIMINVDLVGEITDLIRVLRDYSGSVILASVDQRLFAEAVAALRLCPKWHMEISRLLSPGCIRQAAETVGADRLLFGTGAPAQPVASALHTLNYAGLDDIARELILSGNTLRILNLT